MKYLLLVLVLITQPTFAATFKFGGIKHDISSVATSGGTTTLTKSSRQVQRFTGVLTQNVDLPDATTLLETGWWYIVSNNSTGILTVRDNGANVLGTIPAASGGISTYAVIYLSDASTANGVWDFQKPVPDLSSPVGILSLANGGTNKNMTAVNGGIVYTDADSQEVSAAGTVGQSLVSGGAGSPTWFAPTAGSVLFAGVAGILEQDNANFFWDNTNNRLGILTNAPNVGVDVDSDFALRQSDDATTPTINALGTSGISSIRLTGASAVTLNGISDEFDGKVLVVNNVTGGSLTVSNQNVGAAASERIITGTGADMSVADGAAIIIQYDATSSRWRVIGGSGGGSGITQLTGDVTAGPGSGSQAATIANSAVTNAKMANMATLTVKSNITGGGAAPADNSISAILDAAISSTHGAVLYRGATTWDALAPGTNGFQLTTSGAAANPTWAAAGGAGTVGDWTSYTPTFGSGWGTNTNVSFFYKQVGDSLKVRGTFTSGTLVPGFLSISLPGGYTIDSAKVSVANTDTGEGEDVGRIGTGIANQHAPMVTATGSSTSIVYSGSTFNTNTHLTPSGMVFSSSAHTSVTFEVPIN